MRKKLLTKALAGLMCASMTLSLLPGSAIVTYAAPAATATVTDAPLDTETVPDGTDDQDDADGGLLTEPEDIEVIVDEKYSDYESLVDDFQEDIVEEWHEADEADNSDEILDEPEDPDPYIDNDFIEIFTPATDDEDEDEATVYIEEILDDPFEDEDDLQQNIDPYVDDLLDNSPPTEEVSPPETCAEEMDPFKVLDDTACEDPDDNDPPDDNWDDSNIL